MLQEVGTDNKNVGTDIYSLDITGIVSYIGLRTQMLYSLSVPCLSLMALSVPFYIANYENSFEFSTQTQMDGRTDGC